MALYKVIVHRLNVRKQPVADFDTEEVLPTVSEGMVLDLEEETNVLNPSLGKWFKDKQGQYYWGGGLKVLSAFEINNQDKSIYPGWMTALKLPEIWKYSTGKNVGVAVLDSGIMKNNSDLPYDETNFYLSSSVNNIDDTYGHGTHCAGTIGAKNKGKFKIGVAPNANLFICKISDNGILNPNVDLLEYANAIDWCAKQNSIKVISVSWSNFSTDTALIGKVQAAIDNAVKKGKIILASRGNIHEPNDNSKKYPACLNNVISVGIIPSGNWFNYTGSKDILVPGINVESYDYKSSDMLSTKSGTSMSTAIMAGITALLLEKKGMQMTSSDIKAMITDISITTIIDNETINYIDGNKLLTLINS